MPHHRHAITLSALALSALATLHANAQSGAPAAFVANNGNLEGSVTSFTFQPDGTPVFADRLVIGSRPSLSVDETGCNPVAISIRPDGAYLATSHASGAINDIEQVTIIRVKLDTTLVLVLEEPTPNSGLDCEWITNEFLAVTMTDLSIPNEVIIYRFDENASTLTETDRGATGNFNTALAAHPSGDWLYANNSSGNDIRAFALDGAGSLTPLQTISTGSVFPLGIEVSKGGALLFAAGGISSGADKFNGYRIGPDGMLTPLPGTPFTSPGASPKGFEVSNDDAVLFVEHGTDATVRSFLLDPVTGVPTDAGQSFDVGLQGTLGATAVLGNRLLVTDETTALDGLRGLYSFDINSATGALAMNGTGPVESQGITPESIATWLPCTPDITPPAGLDFFDVLEFLARFDAGDPRADLAAPLGTLDVFDVLLYLELFDTGCP